MANYVKIDLDDLYLDTFVDHDGDRCVQWEDVSRIAEPLDSTPSDVIYGQITIFELLGDN